MAGNWRRWLDRDMGFTDGNELQGYVISSLRDYVAEMMRLENVFRVHIWSWEYFSGKMKWFLRLGRRGGKVSWRTIECCVYPKKVYNETEQRLLSFMEENFHVSTVKREWQTRRQWKGNKTTGFSYQKNNLRRNDIAGNWRRWFTSGMGLVDGISLQGYVGIYLRDYIADMMRLPTL